MYQMIWFRQLSLIFGSAYTAISIVTSVFFLGLACGSWLGGKAANVLAESPRQTMLLYAATELLISLLALSEPFFMELAETAYGFSYETLGHSSLSLALLRAALTSCVLFIPTFFMGATTPLVIQAYSRRTLTLAGDTGIIYGMNAAGAAFGTMVAGWICFRFLGLRETNLLAVTINLLIAATALIMALSEKTLETNKKKTIHQETPENVSPVRRELTFLLIISGISGFLYMGYELLWMRFFQLFFRDSIYMYATCTAVVIVGVALGGSLSGKLANRTTNPRLLLGILFAGAPVLHSLLFLLLSRFHKPIAMLSFQYPLMECAVIGILLLPFMFMGGSFPILAAIMSRESRYIGRYSGVTYAVNTMGSIIGALSTPFLLIPAVGVDGCMMLFLALSLSSATALCLFQKTYQTHIKSLLTCALTILVLVASIAHVEWKKGTIRLIIENMAGYNDILEIRQGVTGTNWVTRSSSTEKVTLFENLIAFSKGGSSSFIVQGFIPLVLLPETPKNVLGLCFGGGLTYKAAQFFPGIRHMDLVDISPTNVHMALKHLDINKPLKKDPRVSFHFDDAYSFVHYSRNIYDLILIDSNPPYYSHNCSTLYSQEFYRLVLEKLSDMGVFTQVLPLKQLTHEEMLSIMHTFASVFPHVSLWWNGSDPLMIGGRKALPLSVAAINEHLENSDTAAALKKYSGDAKYDTTGHFLSGFLMEDHAFRNVAAKGELNSVDRNHLEYSWDVEVDMKNIDAVQENLSSWTTIAELSDQPDIFSSYGEQMEKRRRYLLDLTRRELFLGHFCF